MIVRRDLQILASAEDGRSITPSDANAIQKTKGIYVGASGDLRVEMAGGGVVTFVDLAAGVVHPLQVIRVYATGTTATGIVGLYSYE